MNKRTKILANTKEFTVVSPEPLATIKSSDASRFITFLYPPSNSGAFENTALYIYLNNG